jgi:hypothetical protein
MFPSCRFILLIMLVFVYICEGTIPDKRLSGDPTCSNPISLSKTLIRYDSDDARILSFAKDTACVIYGTSAGSIPEIKEERGYVHKNFVIERKILKISLEFVVNIEEAEGIRYGSVEYVTDKSLKVSNVEMNGHGERNLETNSNDAEQLGLEPAPGS